MYRLAYLLYWACRASAQRPAAGAQHRPRGPGSRGPRFAGLKSIGTSGFKMGSNWEGPAMDVGPPGKALLLKPSSSVESALRGETYFYMEEDEYFLPSEPHYSYEIGVDITLPPKPTHYTHIPVGVPDEHRERCRGPHSCYLVGGNVHVDRIDVVHHAQIEPPTDRVFAVPYMLTGFPARKNMSFHDPTAISGHRASVDISGVAYWRIVIHYNNPHLLSVRDRTVMRLYYTTRPRKFGFLKTAVIAPSEASKGSYGHVGPPSPPIPPGEPRAYLTLVCTVPPHLQDAVLWGGYYHAHFAAKEMYMTLKRRGELTTVAGHDAVQYGLSSEGYRALNSSRGMRLEAGDVFQVTCVYNTVDRTEPTRIGQGGGNEMCLFELDYGVPSGTPPERVRSNPWVCDETPLVGRLDPGVDAPRALARLFD